MKLSIIRIIAIFLGTLALQSNGFAQLSNPFGSQKTVAQQRQDILKKRDDFSANEVSEMRPLNLKCRDRPGLCRDACHSSVLKK